MADSNPDVLDMLAQSIARAMALRLDLGFYEGTGTAPPPHLGAA